MSHNPKSTPSMNLSNSLNVADATSMGCNQTATQSNSQSDTYSETYFDALYSDNSDPWQYQTRWYEKRKREMCLAVLPQAEYDNAIELGCGNGVFSELLARRCQALLSIDGNAQAVKLAKQRLGKSSHSKVIQGVIPHVLLSLEDALLQSYPLSDGASANKPPFDLIVISEILYYLSPIDIDTVITWIKQNLAVGGTLLCCHWRYAIDGFVMTGETVHQRLQRAFNMTNNEVDRSALTHTVFTHPAFIHPAFTHQSQIVDSDFLLDVWQHSPKSVAMQENLI
ncbi:class I SAM-dependent DNA methyltransferase [Psychrobacter sp. ASPA161_9]|uniref:class I SAM-dependent DNA methyltransferase n=1 Tax=Psychrobacter sp. ASPA161_9 TaxID=3160961 RepID=UPI003F7E8068